MDTKVFRVVAIIECSKCQGKQQFDKYVEASDVDALWNRLEYLRIVCSNCRDALPKVFLPPVNRKEILRTLVPAGTAVL
jgi:hypothetical protein